MQSIYLGQDTQNTLKQQQQLLINLSMQQAFHVMQLPQLELAEWLTHEIENNPVLEIDLRKNSHSCSLGEMVNAKEKEEMQPLSLYEHLMTQAALIFESREELQLAELLIGHLNEKGYLDTPLEEIGPDRERLYRVLLQLQTCDPPGIAATSVQESLLIQLHQQGKRNSLAEKIIALHFEELLHNRITLIAKKLKVSPLEVARVVEGEILSLDFNPGYRFSQTPLGWIVPDLFFLHAEDKIHVEINSSHLPTFRIAPFYAYYRTEEMRNEETLYFKRHFSQGTWLQHIVKKRHKTLKAIGELIVKVQSDFLLGTSSKLLPMTMREAAEELHLNESTVARAVANKYVACPEGVFQLRAFFQQGLATEAGGKVSNFQAKELLKTWIEKEDKSTPLSDEGLAQQFEKHGVRCSRRTVTKYRTQLNIGPAAQRRKRPLEKI